MPELPEVQTIVNDLKKLIINRTIRGVWLDAPALIKKPKPKTFAKQIKGLKIAQIERKGKNIIIYLIQKSKIKNQNDPEQIASQFNGASKLKFKIFLLLIHQKLTGHLLCGKWSIRKAQPSPLDKLGAWDIRKRPSEYKITSLLKGPLEEKVNNYIHLVFYLDNGWQLALSDLRKFAKVMLIKEDEFKELDEIKKLGPDALAVDFQTFTGIVKNSSQKIKQVLMDQEKIAGIGNIYSDEILWFAKVYPLKPANALEDREIKKIFENVKKVLKKAINLRGASISDYRDPKGKRGGYDKIRKVYGREGEKCPQCFTLIKRLKIAGRFGHFCPACQRLEPIN